MAGSHEPEEGVLQRAGRRPLTMSAAGCHVNRHQDHCGFLAFATARGAMQHFGHDAYIWAGWLLQRRARGDPEVSGRVRKELDPIRDRVLDGAQLGSHDRLLDVGCGDGLIAFGALERGQPEVIFSDVSQDLLDTSTSTFSPPSPGGGSTSIVRRPTRWRPR